jgi:hypothetical protein
MRRTAADCQEISEKNGSDIFSFYASRPIKIGGKRNENKPKMPLSARLVILVARWLPHRDAKR